MKAQLLKVNYFVFKLSFSYFMGTFISFHLQARRISTKNLYREYRTFKWLFLFE